MIKKVLNQFILTPSGLACLITLVFCFAGLPEKAAPFIITALICWAIDLHAEKTRPLRVESDYLDVGKLNIDFGDENDKN